MPAGESGSPGRAQPQDSEAVRTTQPFSLAVALAVAAGLRFWELGRASLWYDEVVTMRLARQANPTALLRLLFEIDATRAPLHPLLLQGWLRLTGPSDAAGRAFSAVCGVLTVAVVHAIGRDAFNRRVACWAAWLVAIAPALVRYSREVRMYSWLVLVTCLAWRLLVVVRRGERAGPVRDRIELSAWAVAMAAIAYSHPLGLLMNAALMIGSALIWQRSWVSWLLAQLGWIVLVAPWARFYLDHGPESVVDRASIRMLLGLPIEFIGGNFAVLAVVAGVIGWGGFRAREGPVWRALLAWFAIPPLVLFAYSQAGHSLFGPARYTLYVAPAYLLLAAVGLAELSWRLAVPLAIVGAVLSGSLLGRSVYPDDLKADWRRAAVELGRLDRVSGLVVVATDSARNVEVETARYYLPPHWRAVPQLDDQGVPWSESIAADPAETRAFAVGVREGRPIRPIDPAFQGGELIRLAGLDLVVVRSGGLRDPGPDRASDR